MDTLKMVVKLYKKRSWTCQYEACSWSMVPFISGFTLINESNESDYLFILLSPTLLFPQGIFYLFSSWGSCCCHFGTARPLTSLFLWCTLRNYSMMITIIHLGEPPQTFCLLCMLWSQTCRLFKGCHFPQCWQRNYRGDKGTKNVTELTSLSKNMLVGKVSTTEV